MYSHIFFIILTFVPLLFFCLKFKTVSNFLGIYDLPNKKKKIHSTKVPLLGGFIFFLYFNIFFIFDILYFSIIPKNISLIFLCYTNIFFVIGVIDDKFTVKPVNKIFATILFLIFLHYIFRDFYLHKIYVASFDKLLTLNFLITLFCFLLLQIAVNLSDGTNGTVGLYSIFWAIILIYLSRNFFVNIILFLFIITLILFLFFNFQSKVFLGTAGCNYISIFFSVISVFLNNNQIIPAEYFVSLFFIPGIDMIRIFVLRLTNNKNVFSYDRNHLHHILQYKFNKYNSILYLLICISFFFISLFFLNKSYYLQFLTAFSLIYVIFINLYIVKNKNINFN